MKEEIGFTDAGVAGGEECALLADPRLGKVNMSRRRRSVANEAFRPARDTIRLEQSDQKRKELGALGGAPTHAGAESTPFGSRPP